MFPARRWFPAQPLLFRARQSRQAFARSLGPVPLVPVFVPEWESVPLVRVFVGALE